MAMNMARIELANSPNAADAETLFQLGMRYAAAASTPDDRVAAHMWLNIAAMGGNAEADRLRREVAAEMSPSEIAAAQRAARDYVTRH